MHLLLFVKSLYMHINDVEKAVSLTVENWNAKVKVGST